MEILDMAGKTKNYLFRPISPPQKKGGGGRALRTMNICKNSCLQNIFQNSKEIAGEGRQDQYYWTIDKFPGFSR